MVINGPNLNMLGMREPEIYGHTTLEKLDEHCRKYGEKQGLSVTCHQSNHEGALITWCQEARTQQDGIIINAGAYSHTSIAIPDALRAFDNPVIEVHISNIYKREHYRHTSNISAVATAVICGMGVQGYFAALDYFAICAKNNAI